MKLISPNIHPNELKSSLKCYFIFLFYLIFSFLHSFHSFGPNIHSYWLLGTWSILMGWYLLITLLFAWLELAGVTSNFHSFFMDNWNWDLKLPRATEEQTSRPSLLGSGTIRCLATFSDKRRFFLIEWKVSSFPLYMVSMNSLISLRLPFERSWRTLLPMKKPSGFQNPKGLRSSWRL